MPQDEPILANAPTQHDRSNESPGPSGIGYDPTLVGRYLDQVRATTRFADFTGLPLPRDDQGGAFYPALPLDQIQAESPAHNSDGLSTPERDEKSLKSQPPKEGSPRIQATKHPGQTNTQDLVEDFASDISGALVDDLRQIVILGGAGSGKSTLLRSIAFREPTKGPLGSRADSAEGLCLGAFARYPALSCRVRVVCGEPGRSRLAYDTQRASPGVPDHWLIDGLDEALGWAPKVLDQLGGLVGCVTLTTRTLEVPSPVLATIAATFTILEIQTVHPDQTQPFFQGWFLALAVHQGRSTASARGATQPDHSAIGPECHPPRVDGQSSPF